MLKSRLILLLFVLNLHAKTSGAQSLETIDFRMVQQLAKKIGDELWNVGDAITKRVEVQESFSQARVVNKSGSKLVDEIARDIRTMLDVRAAAVKRIVETAEAIPRVFWNTTDYNNTYFYTSRARDTWRDVELKENEEEAIRLEKASMEPNYTKEKIIRNYEKHEVCFQQEYFEDSKEEHGCYMQINETINLKSNESSVYVSADVFDRDLNMTWMMYRTKGLDKAFFNNYKIDPTISWQYFCNLTGYMRHFPAADWNVHPVNTYDCRTRHWFTGAAVSPKDMIVLVERSGSMKGVRLRMAQSVVRNILDTLTPNDFFNIIQFNDTIEYMDNCTEKTLVQATSFNVLHMKLALDAINPRGQSDLAEALYEAFALLEKNKRSTANCNQAIVLITDGMEYNQTIQNIFKTHNWDKGNKVRVFSYLVGEQISEVEYKQVEMMACENRGFYTKVDLKEKAESSETKETALRYLPVMARPLVLSTHIPNPMVWSPLYADLIDAQRITNNDWNCKQNEKQRKRIVSFLKQYDSIRCISDKDDEKINSEFRKYVFMTTVSMPAFDRGINATLMGVAAVDVPLFEFERLFQEYRLGLGAYAFVVDQNGNILTHPDFKPFFQGGILKPSYNSLDLSEVELIDDDHEPRLFSSYFTEFRESILIKDSGFKNLSVLQPFDDMRRVISLKRFYFWRRIKTTPFTVVVTYPENLVGRVSVPDDFDSMMSKGSNLIKYFKDDNFRLHPDWVYCRSIRKSFEDMKLGEIDPDNCEMTPEEELIFYLEKFEAAGWKWKQDKLDSNDTKCDRKLMQLLLFDAKSTENFPADISKRAKENYVEKFHVKTSFIATHSGLLRYKVFDKKVSADSFGDKMKRSINEIWYKRAVEFNRKNTQSFVYSVPFNAYEEDEPEITGTHAIFIQEKIPVAVIGFKFAHSNLESMMEELCPRRKMELCYILDDNAYILSDPEAEHAGRFFGEVERKIMQILIDDKVYETTRVLDYQAVCYDDRQTKYEKLMKIRSSALSVKFWNPLKQIFAILTTILTMVQAIPSYMSYMMYPDPEHFYDDSSSDYHCLDFKGDEEFLKCLKWDDLSEDDIQHPKYKDCQFNRFKKCREENGTANILKRHLTRSRPIKCDKLNIVYSLTKDESNFLKPYDECSRPFVVHKIPHSNLILLVTNRLCAQVFATEREFDNVPETIPYINSTFCRRMKVPQLYRGRPSYCTNFHSMEPKYNYTDKADNTHCGRGYRLEIHNLILTLSSMLSLLKFLISRYI